MAEKTRLRQVGFRLPDTLVQKIDSEAEMNYRDRTGEIIHALKTYYEIKDEKQDINETIRELTAKIDALEKKLQKAENFEDFEPDFTLKLKGPQYQKLVEDIKKELESGTE